MRDIYKIVSKKRTSLDMLGLISLVLISAQIVFVVLMMYHQLRF